MPEKLFVVDVTNVVDVPFISGIQRVTLEIVVRLLRREGQNDFRFLFLSYDVFAGAYRIVRNDLFLEGYRNKVFRGGKLAGGAVYQLENIPKDSIFFDIDSVWNNRMRRSFLLPYLKKRGVKIAVFVHDIIPVILPQYCDRETAMRFMDYIGAHAKYADVIIGNSQNTITDMEKLLAELELPIPHMAVAPLGADFKLKQSEKTSEHPVVQGLRGKKYLLAVGTIEPRKNYDFLLDFYEQKLKFMNIELVVCGRQGWNVDAVMARILKMNHSEKGFHYVGYANDILITDLYRNAFFMILTTHYEGFGLPVIEAFHYQTPALVPDIPVFREVGGEYCDYYDSDDMLQLEAKLVFYEKNPEQYASRKEQLKAYKPGTWNQAEELIWQAVEHACISSSSSKKACTN